MRTELRADCTRCAALCCVGLAFASPAEFAIAKPAGVPCPNLAPDDRCTIHDRLPQRGFPGCAAFDCLGAGQRVTAAAPVHWRDDPAAAVTFAALPVVVRLHELLFFLADARARTACAGLHPDLDAAAREVEDAAARAARSEPGLDDEAVRRDVAPLLEQASRLVRAQDGEWLRRADLSGRGMRGADLADADLRGALLLGTDLRDADLSRADLIGVDLRGADLRGARLTDALFVLPGRLAGARGDGRTALPPGHARPRLW